MTKLIFIFAIIFFSPSVIFAQQVNKGIAKRIAFINEGAFDSSETGILKLTRALDQMEMIDCYPLPCTQEQREAKRKTVVEPVLSEITDLLKQIEIYNKVVILPGFKLELNGQLLPVDKKFEITEQFINFFNNKTEKSTQTLTLNIPESKIGAINTNTFYDRANGIKRINKITSEKIIDLKTTCQNTIECREIGKYIQSYATKKGYSVIFDSSKTIPEEIKSFDIDDLTKDFISDYNKNNP